MTTFSWKEAGLLSPSPLREAVQAGIFGVCRDGSLSPSRDEIAAMTEEHARESLSTLCDLRHLRRCLRRKLNPHTRRPVQVRDVWERIEASMQQGVTNLEQHYAACLDAYASAFGIPACDTLDTCVRELLERPEFALDPKQAKV